MIHVTFPDGASRAFEPNISGLEIAKSISPSLAKRTVAMALDGVIHDLADPIEKDSKIEFLGRDAPRVAPRSPSIRRGRGNAGRGRPGSRRRSARPRRR